MGLVELYTHSGSSKFSSLQINYCNLILYRMSSLVELWHADPSMLAFRDLHHFLAGQLHKFRETWLSIASQTDCDTAKEVLGWIEDGVNVFKYFQRFRGSFKLSKEKILTVTCLLAKFFRIISVNLFPPSFPRVSPLSHVCLGTQYGLLGFSQLPGAC